MTQRITVKVHPNSSKDNLILMGTSAEVWVKARAENNAANLAVVKLLSKALEKPTANIRLISGATSKKKIFMIS